MSRSSITYSSVRKEAFTITWTKKNGKFDPKGELLSAIINPRRYVEAMEYDFTNYVAELRARKPTPAKERFLAAIEMKWRLGKPGPLVGMTEEEFRGGA